MKIYLSPKSPRLGDGGVMNVIYYLGSALTDMGHEIVDKPHNADVIHGHAFNGSPHIYTSHGVYPSEHPMEYTNAELYSNIAVAEVVTAVSRWTANQFTHLGVNPHIIYNGVDYDGLQKYRRKSEGYILWAKNNADKVTNPLDYIYLAANYPDRKFLMTVAPKDVNLPDNVEVVGLQSYEDMMRLLAGAEVYVSTGTENLPTQVLEAMALGVPVLAMPSGGVSEISGITLSGLPATVLGDVIKKRDKLGEAGAKIAQKNYNWHDIAAKYIELYKKAITPGNGKVSVVIPCFNLASKVTRAVESVLSQSKPADEIIVVDDGSTDNPEVVLKKYADRIKFVRQDNAGVAAARNNGVKQAIGEFVCCLDADDALSVDFLETTYRHINTDKRIGIAYTGMRVVDWNGTMLSDFPGEMNPSLSKLAQGNFIPCANLFRKRAWERARGYKNINPSWEDYDLWLTILEVGFKAHYVPNARFIYTTSDKGRTGQEQRENHSRLLRAKVDGFHPRLYGNAGLVTFVIPCYNQWEYVLDAVGSAWAQSYPHIEVIVVDDCSTEDYDKHLKTLQVRFPKTRVIQREKNGGLSAARNSGIWAATGGWIVPLDADDKVDPEFVAECMKVVYNTDSYAYTDVYVWHDYGRGPTELLPMATFNPDRLIENHQHACTILIQRDWIIKAGMYDEDMRDGWEDYEFVVRMVKSGHCGYHIGKPLFYYRWRENSMRQESDKKIPELSHYIWTKHSDVKEGRSLMSCCGGNNVPLMVNDNTPKLQAGMVVPTGYIMLQYTGNKAGDMTKIGGAGRIYRYNSIEPLFTVHEDDLMLFTSPTFLVVSTATVEQPQAQIAQENVLDYKEVIPEGNDDFLTLEGVTPDDVQKLYAKEINSFARLIAAPDDDFVGIFPKSKVKKIKTAAMLKARASVGA